MISISKEKCSSRFFTRTTSHASLIPSVLWGSEGQEIKVVEILAPWIERTVLSSSWSITFSTVPSFAAEKSTKITVSGSTAVGQWTRSDWTSVGGLTYLEHPRYAMAYFLWRSIWIRNPYERSFGTFYFNKFSKQMIFNSKLFDHWLMIRLPSAVPERMLWEHRIFMA